VHNGYLLLLLKLGVNGFECFLVLIAAVFRVARSALRLPYGSLEYCIAVGFTANIVQFLFAAVTNYTFCKPVNMTYMAFAVGGLVWLAKRAEAGGAVGATGARRESG
jgi:hypothetical protein